MLAPLALVFGISAGRNSMSASTTRSISRLRGADGPVAVDRLRGLHPASIARVFFETAAAFGALSLYGYTTKRSLSAMGSFLMMGLFGLIIASVVNLFVQSSAFQFGLSILGSADLRRPDRLGHPGDQADAILIRRRL